MQKKLTKRPYLIQKTILGFLENRFQGRHLFMGLFKRSILSLIIVALAACASHDNQRINLKELDISPVQVSAPTPLMKAAAAGDGNALKAALLSGEKLNAHTQEASAFSLSLLNKHEAISRILLSAGSDWRKGFQENQTSALIVAADNSFDEIVKMLISKGAPIEFKDAQGYSALARAAKNGHLTTLKILINAGAQVNGTPEGKSVLMHVVENNNMLISQMLIAAGADLHYQDEQGDTALRIARRNGFFDLDLMLIQAGARP